jgi:hypothetical protein
MSRQITADAMQKMYAYKTFKRGNTHVKITANYEAEMYLHNNNIAILSPNNRRLYIRNAGWFSVTTKERLNGILGRTPYHIRQKDFKWDIMRKSTNEIVLHDWNGEWFTIEGNEIYN